MSPILHQPSFLLAAYPNLFERRTQNGVELVTATFAKSGPIARIDILFGDASKVSANTLIKVVNAGPVTPIPLMMGSLSTDGILRTWLAPGAEFFLRTQCRPSLMAPTVALPDAETAAVLGQFLPIIDLIDANPDAAQPTAGG